MADIEVVIKIDEEDYKSIKDDAKKFLLMPSHKVPVLYDAVNNGTPIDLEGLKSDMKALNCDSYDGLDYYYLLDCLDKRLGITIIEADKEKNNANSN